MTTVADNESNLEVRLDGVENRLGNVETRSSNLSERVAYLEGRLEMAQSLRGVRESFRLTVIAIWFFGCYCIHEHDRNNCRSCSHSLDDLTVVVEDLHFRV